MKFPNERHFDVAEMLNNMQRFGMRGIKGIRKKDVEKIKKNLVISFSFFVSILNRLKIDLEEEVWKRFPYVCSYCNSITCSCRETKPEKRQKVFMDNSRRPKTLLGFQKMFGEIYPAQSRTIEHSGIHLAEEMGEFSEAVWAYRSDRSEEEFGEIMLEAADFFSCIMGVFNSVGLNLAEEIARHYPNNCHECHQAPCVCSYDKIKEFRS